MGQPKPTTLRRLFAAAGRTCAFPGCERPNFDGQGRQLADVAHICSDKPGGARYDPDQTEAERQGFDNLVVLCGTHHRQVDVAPEDYPVTFLHAIKAAQEASSGPSAASTRPARSSASTVVAGNVGPTVVASPHAVVGQAVTVRTSRGGAKIQPPAGTIGSDARASRYISYLIGRYNEFASREPSRARKFNYGAITKNVEAEFDGPWRLQPLTAFDAVCSYLHRRIDRTRLARINRGKGHRSYRSFEEFS